LKGANFTGNAMPHLSNSVTISLDVPEKTTSQDTETYTETTESVDNKFI